MRTDRAVRTGLRPALAGWLCGLTCLGLAPIAACAPVVAPEPPIAAIVERFASPETFRIKPEQAVRHFEPVATTTSKGPGRHLWVFDASEPGHGIRWLRIEFQPAEAGGAKWTLLQGTAALPPQTQAHPDIYRTLRTALVERLGRPQRSDESRAGKTTEWSLGGGRMVVLRRGAFDHPHLRTPQQVVLIEAAVAQGEEEDPPRR